VLLEQCEDLGAGNVVELDAEHVAPSLGQTHLDAAGQKAAQRTIADMEVWRLSGQAQEPFARLGERLK